MVYNASVTLEILQNKKINFCKVQSIKFEFLGDI